VKPSLSVAVRATGLQGNRAPGQQGTRAQGQPKPDSLG